jgi:hypothetical protein
MLRSIVSLVCAGGYPYHSSYNPPSPAVMDTAQPWMESDIWVLSLLPFPFPRPRRLAEASSQTLTTILLWLYKRLSTSQFQNHKPFHSLNLHKLLIMLYVQSYVVLLYHFPYDFVYASFSYKMLWHHSLVCVYILCALNKLFVERTIFV